VNLPKDGIVYGFALVVKSRAGLGKPAPHAGDLPQVRVEVDTKLPLAELFAPQPAPERPDALLLIWKVEDRNLDPNGVTLEWSASRDGKWEPIGGPQLPNTGRYVWAVPDQVPPRVFLRLTARDTAGNVAVALTDKPVLIDLTIPDVNVLGVSAGVR
jgi:hypothetical protein